MSEEKRSSGRVLLAVLAHPDDESFGTGGTLALYASQGVQVHLVCGTRGESGEVDPEYLEGYESISARREHELRCAAQILGLAGVHFLDYRDSGMQGSADNTHPRALAAAPLEEVAAKVVRYIRTLKPQVVITFDPIGGYHHPDHVAMHKATLRAFYAAGAPEQFADGLSPYKPQKLYFHTIPRGFLRLAVRILPLFGRDPHKWGRNNDIDLVKVAEADFPTHAVVDYGAVAQRKDEASACHASQGGSMMVRGVMGWFMRLFGRQERYMRAYPPPEPGRVERDLFAGVASD